MREAQLNDAMYQAKHVINNRSKHDNVWLLRSSAYETSGTLGEWDTRRSPNLSLPIRRDIHH
jgi:hypothetical protein